jgi:AbiV family abortive infection protein
MNDFSMPIPSKELCEGVKLSIRNAERLVKDAEILYDNGCYSSASFLAIVALEEEGKASMLLKGLLVHKDIPKKQWNDKFKNHKRKLIATQERISKHRKLRIKVGSKRWKQVHLTDLAKIFLEQKDDCLYVDWDFKTRRTQITGKWKSPLKDVVSGGFPLIDKNKRRETAEGLIYEAKLGLEASRSVVEEEMKTSSNHH